MAPSVVDVVGLNASSNGRSCEIHDICGSVLEVDTLVRFKSVQVVINGREETAIAAHWVTDGVDRCRVGFLPRCAVKNKDAFDGKLAQITEFLDGSSSAGDRAKSHRGRGVCRAVLVDESEARKAKAPPNPSPDNKKKPRIIGLDDSYEEGNESS